METAPGNFKSHDSDFSSSNTPTSSSYLTLTNSSNSSSRFPISAVEMLCTRSPSYTSLKDLLPECSPEFMSSMDISSWNEIPIRNPLVKQAALAYLLPMSSRQEPDGSGILSRLKEKCLCADAGELGCLGWINDSILKLLREALRSFCEKRRLENGEEEAE